MFNGLIAFMLRLEKNPVFYSIRKGFILLIPIVLTGSIALLVKNFPFDILQTFYVENPAGTVIAGLLVAVYESTVGFMSLFLLLGISYFYSLTFTFESPTHHLFAVSTSFACFLASFGAVSGTLTMSAFGPLGVFTAIICAILATALFFVLDKMTRRRDNTYTLGADVQYIDAMTGMLPMFACVVIFAVANFILRHTLGVGNVNELIQDGLSSLFSGFSGEVAGSLLFAFVLNFLWSIGIHGGNALDSVAKQIFSAAENNPDVIISKTMLDNFASIGGSGMSICLLLALLLASRSKGSRRLAVSSVPLLTFNINETLTYGLPIVLNPIMMIPFIVVPVVSLLITYTAVAVGFMPHITHVVTWTTPVFFSGYAATESWRGIAVQVVLVAAGTAIYIPFVKGMERLHERRTEIMISELTDMLKEDEKAGTHSRYLTRHDNAGVIAKTIVSKLISDINGGVGIPVFYQPQIDNDERVMGAEALLRWRFNDVTIYPPLVIALARESGYFNRLTWEIFTRVCEDTVIFRKEISENIKISANFSAEQLNSREIIDKIIFMTKELDICGNIVIEATEESSLNNFQLVSEHIDLLNSQGLQVAIDDFSMGQTSIDYLRNNHVQYVKLDGGLVRQLVSNPRVSDIVASIVSLGKSLGFGVVAEYVESQELHDMLADLGCHHYQGYLYSPAVKAEQFIEYANKNSKQVISIIYEI